MSYRVPSAPPSVRASWRDRPVGYWYESARACASKVRLAPPAIPTGEQPVPGAHVIFFVQLHQLRSQERRITNVLEAATHDPALAHELTDQLGSTDVGDFLEHATGVNSRKRLIEAGAALAHEHGITT